MKKQIDLNESVGKNIKHIYNNDEFVIIFFDDSFIFLLNYNTYIDDINQIETITDNIKYNIINNLYDDYMDVIFKDEQEIVEKHLRMFFEDDAEFKKFCIEKENQRKSDERDERIQQIDVLKKKIDDMKIELTILETENIT